MIGNFPGRLRLPPFTQWQCKKGFTWNNEGAYSISSHVCWACAWEASNTALFSQVMDFVSEILIISSVSHFFPSSSLPLRTCPYTLQGEFPQALLSRHVTFTPGHKQLDLEWSLRESSQSGSCSRGLELDFWDASEFGWTFKERSQVSDANFVFGFWAKNQEKRLVRK